MNIVNVVPSRSHADWPELPEEARCGLAGDVVRTIEPHSEADPVALLVQFLAFFGNVVGREAGFTVESDRHGLNLFMVLVGVSSKGRKGTARAHIQRLFADVDTAWTERIVDGLSSGEGLIWAVRDPIEQTTPVRQKGRFTGEYETVIVDQGVDDKRLMVIEGEFASTLKVMRREGNILSATIRNAWDSGNLQTLTKNSPARATGAHISIIGHITRDELLRCLDSTEAANGFGNRFLWVCVRRSKLLPEGGHLDEADLVALRDRIRMAVGFVRGVREFRRDEDARKMWHSVYPVLSDGRPGLLGSMIARAEAQVLRLSCLFAGLDCSDIIRPQHLCAALAVWQYCEASARYLFGNSVGNSVADQIFRALRASPEGLTRTEIRDLFNRNKTKNDIDLALDLLRSQNFAEFEWDDKPGGARKVQRWHASPPATTYTTYTTSGPEQEVRA